MRNPAPIIGTPLQRHFEQVFELWDELSNFGTHESDAGARLCMERIAGWLGAQNAFWVGAVHVLKSANGVPVDVMDGWRIRAIHPLHPQYHDAGLNRKLVRVTHSDMDPGAANIALAAGVGRFRAYTLQSGVLVDVEAFQRTDHYDFFYRQRGIGDRIWVAFPVNADVESFFCFDRLADRPPFSADDLELVKFALRGIRWFHRQLLLSHGLGLCVEPLTPAERRVIQALLSGASERVIADDLNLTRGTVHQYATRVYRKFGVRGRTEFTALWLMGRF